MEVTKLEDRWSDRDFPVLVTVGRLLEEEPGAVLPAALVAQEAGLDERATITALLALTPGYLQIERVDELGGDIPDALVRSLTERGRRAVGLWPQEGSVEALVYALERAAEQAPTTEQRSRLQRAAQAVAGVGRDVMVEVLAAAAGGRIPGL